MKNSHTFMPIARTAQRCCLVLLLLLTTGMSVGGTHPHVENSGNSHETSSDSELRSTHSSEGVAEMAALAASSSCPSQVPCHQNVFYSTGTDLALFPLHRSSRLRLAGDTTFTDSSTSLDYPPPKA